MIRWLPSFLLFTAAALPLELTIDPQPGRFFTATFAGPAPCIAAGQFRGSVSLNGSPAEMPLVGRAEQVGSGARLRATLRYADVPADWVSRFRPDTFDYSIRGGVEGLRAISCSGTLGWEQVVVEGGREALSRFVKLTSLELTALSARRSEGRAVLTVDNPFSFPIAVAAASYDLRIHEQRIGGGARRGQILRGQRKGSLELPLTVDHERFLAAAGTAWAVGAELDAKLLATLTLRFPQGDLSVSVTLQGRMGTDGARSGVFSLPEGGTSLSLGR